MKTKLMLALACAGILAACAQNTPSVVESRYNMHYSFTDLNDSGVVQVFDDGNRTYLQYRTTVDPDATPSITVPDTHLVMKAHRTGNYWVVDGVFGAFYVVLAGRPALVNNDAIPHAPPVEPQPVPVKESVSSAPPTLTVHFSGGSTSLSTAEQANVAAFALKAKDAQSLVIRGFSGFETPSDKGVALASGRAIALRWALIHEGVDPQRTKMVYKSYGGLVGDPKTAGGSAANRRAEAVVLSLGS